MARSLDQMLMDLAFISKVEIEYDAEDGTFFVYLDGAPDHGHSSHSIVRAVELVHRYRFRDFGRAKF